MCKTCPGVVDCAHDRETDEWPAPTWRNPRFQAATSTLGGHAGTESDVGAESSPVGVEAPARPSAPVLGRDGGERPTVERIDKYTVRVDGIDVVAGPETESRLRQMDAEQRRMFARIMQADR